MCGISRDIRVHLIHTCRQTAIHTESLFYNIGALFVELRGDLCVLFVFSISSPEAVVSSRELTSLMTLFIFSLVTFPLSAKNSICLCYQCIDFCSSLVLSQ